MAVMKLVKHEVATTQQVLLWLVLVAHAAVAVIALSAQQRQGWCPSKCGDVDIPYPFGIGEKCAWSPGFALSCNHTFNPPRPYLGDFEIINILLEAGEMRVYTRVLTDCFTSPNTTEYNGTANFSVDLSSSIDIVSPVMLARSRNEFTAIGCGTLGFLGGREDGSYLTGCITTCASMEDAARDGEPCTGLGCCQVPSIPPNLTTSYISSSGITNLEWNRSAPCNHVFVAEKGWYNFSRQDFSRNGSKSFAMSDGLTSIRTVLDWAIRKNGSCSSSDARGAPACVSAHSYCVNATNGEGYLCNCSTGYTGNPYVNGGCININECDPSIYKDQYPCHDGTCHDLEGSYKCKCNFGRRKDKKKDNVCQPILPKSAIVVIAMIFAAAVLSILFIFLHTKYEKKKLRDSFNKNGGQLLKKHRYIKIFTKQELGKITNNYTTILGKGGFGEVYMGTTDEKQKVAVKRSITVNEARQKDFANEVTIQSQISHKNVVRLVGCCLETNIPTLVFEYISKGSLHDVLHGNGNDSNNDVGKHTLSLQVRLAIAIESADALAYMHSYGSQKILHGDVKSGNILLDDNFMAKVSDFGISRRMSIEKQHTYFVVGDMNYMDPVYMKTGKLTEKSDVYSFGVVLLELITRKKARYDGNNSLPINFVKYYMTDSRAREMFDDEITSPEFIDCLEMIGKIAVQCLKNDVDERPPMKQVLDNLNLVRNKLMDANTSTSELFSCCD